MGQEIFSEEFAAQAQAQLGEAMKLLSKEDPQLWQQLQGCTAAASSAGGEGKGEAGKEAEGEGGSIEATLEDTLRRLRESTEQIEVGHHYILPRLPEMRTLGHLLLHVRTSFFPKG